MSLEPLLKEEDRNPRTLEEARAFVKHVESLFMPWNVEALVRGFTEDCVVRFGSLPEIRGREALGKFFELRRAKQKNYRLQKRLRTLTGDTMTNVWEGDWEDAETGAKMKGFGVELWVMRQGKIAVWEAAFNAAAADRPQSVGELIG